MKREFSHKGVPTTYSVCSRSQGGRNYMKIILKFTCLFFDQVNIYGQLLVTEEWSVGPSTELSTDFVDKTAIG